MQKYTRNALFMATVLACSPAALADDAPAAPAAAPAKPAGPTLSDILTNSGIELKGYVDVSAEGSDLATQGSGLTTHGNPYKVFDYEHANFSLHQVGVTIDKLPAEGFGGLLNLTIGKDADVIRSYGAGSTGYFDATQAFIQYKHGASTLQLGKFVTLAGNEYIDSSADTNVSRSILFASIPFTHTGVRYTYALSDTTNLIAGLNNGWDQVADANTQKTVELGVTSNPIKPLNLAATIYSGVEPLSISNGVATTQGGNRTLFDFVVSYAVSDALTLILNGDYGTQEGLPTATGTQDGKWYGGALYANYQLDPNNRFSLRLEDVTDEEGYKFFSYDGKSHEVQEVTFTYGYLAAANFELRAEARYDQAKDNDFVKPDGTLSKSGTTVLLAGLLKF